MNRSYVYAQPPVYCYQSVDRQNLQFTNYPVFQVFNPPPPKSPRDEQPADNGGAGDDGSEPEDIEGGEEGFLNDVDGECF